MSSIIGDSYLYSNAGSGPLSPNTSSLLSIVSVDGPSFFVGGSGFLLLFITDCGYLSAVSGFFLR